jgi:hypothetical protein
MTVPINFQFISKLMELFVLLESLLFKRQVLTTKIVIDSVEEDKRAVNRRVIFDKFKQ